MKKAALIPFNRTSDSGSTDPDWIHLLPAGRFGSVRGVTFTNDNPESIIARSMKHGKIVLDENHSTDLAAPRGGESPACGWIVAMKSKADGIWGKVEWTKKGEALLKDKAYRWISPVLLSANDTNEVTEIVRAALTNNPNLELASLHSAAEGYPPASGNPSQQIGEKMDLEELRKALGLPEGASKEDILACLKDHKATSEGMASMMGMAKGAKSKEILEKAKKEKESKSLHSAAENEEIEKLQSQVSDLTGKLNEQRADAFVEKAGRTKIVSEQARKTLHSLYQKDPKEAENVLACLQDAPKGETLTLNGAVRMTPIAGENTKSFEALDHQLGLSADDLKKYGA